MKAVKEGACAPNSADGGRCKRSLYILIRQLSFHPPCLACCCIACRCQKIGHLRPPTRPSAASIATSSVARRGHSQSTGAHLVAFMQSTSLLVLCPLSTNLEASALSRSVRAIGQWCYCATSSAGLPTCKQPTSHSNRCAIRHVAAGEHLHPVFQDLCNCADSSEQICRQRARVRGLGAQQHRSGCPSIVACRTAGQELPHLTRPVRACWGSCVGRSTLGSCSSEDRSEGKWQRGNSEECCPEVRVREQLAWNWQAGVQTNVKARANTTAASQSMTTAT